MTEIRIGGWSLEINTYSLNQRELEELIMPTLEEYMWKFSDPLTAESVRRKLEEMIGEYISDKRTNSLKILLDDAEEKRDP